MQNVPIDLKIFLSSPYFLCHTVWILWTDSFQKEQKNINVAFSYGRLHWGGVISDGIDVYSIWKYSFPLIDQFTVSWHLIKVFFSTVSHRADSIKTQERFQSGCG